MARKQVLLLMLEEKHDHTILRDPLTRILKQTNDQLVVLPAEFEGDLLTRKPSRNGIVSVLENRLQNRLDLYGLEAENVSRVIHIVDTDGCYIPDQAIQAYNSTLKLQQPWKAYYLDTGILAKSVTALQLRNRYKRENLEILTNLDTVMEIAYRIYYMACNVEHVFGGDRNCSSDQKTQISDYLRKKYKSDPHAFSDILRSFDHGASNWESSWEALQEDVRSLERGTNLRFAIPGLYEDEGGD